MDLSEQPNPFSIIRRQGYGVPAEIVQGWYTEGNNPVSLSSYFLSPAAKGNKLLIIMSNSIVNSAYPLFYNMSPNGAYLSNFELLGEQERVHIFCADIINDIPANTSFLSFTQTANNNYRSVHIQSYELAGVDKTQPFSTPVFTEFTAATTPTSVINIVDRANGVVFVNYTSPTIGFHQNKTLTNNFIVEHAGAQGNTSPNGLCYMINGYKHAPLNSQEYTDIYPPNGSGVNVIFTARTIVPVPKVVEFAAQLAVSINFDRQLINKRLYPAVVSLQASLTRQFSSLCQFSAGLNAAADLSRFVSALRSWNPKTVLQASLTRQFRAFRGFRVDLGVSAALAQLFDVVKAFSAQLSLAADFGVLRIPVLRAAVFDAGLSVQSGFSRSAELARRVFSSLGVAAGVKRVLTVVRGFLVSSRLASVMEFVRFSVLRTAVFSVKISLESAFSRQIQLIRRYLSALSASAILQVTVWLSRSFPAKLSLSDLWRVFSGKLHYALKLFEIQPQPPRDTNDDENKEDDDVEEEVDR